MGILLYSLSWTDVTNISRYFSELAFFEGSWTKIGYFLFFKSIDLIFASIIWIFTNICSSKFAFYTKLLLHFYYLIFYNILFTVKLNFLWCYIFFPNILDKLIFFPRFFNCKEIVSTLQYTQLFRLAYQSSFPWVFWLEIEGKTQLEVFQI